MPTYGYKKRVYIKSMSKAIYSLAYTTVIRSGGMRHSFVWSATTTTNEKSTWLEMMHGKEGRNAQRSTR